MRTSKADLHNHFTTKSRILDVNKVSDTVRQRLGRGGICALVNYDDKRFEAFAERAEPYGNRLGNAVYFPDRDVLIVKGEEVPTDSGDLLSLAIEEGVHLTQRESIPRTVEEIRDKGGLAIIPHPYFHSNVGATVFTDIKNFHDKAKITFEQADTPEQPPKYLQDISGVETHNGNVLFEDARNLARNLWSVSTFRWGSLSCSDGHSFREVGNSYTYLQMPSLSSITSGIDLTASLDKAIRNSIGVIIDRPGSTSMDRTSYTGSLMHAISLMPYFIPVFGRKLNRGDAEALR